MTLHVANAAVDRSGKRILTVETLQLRPGQLTAVVGPNGAGKSTLLSLLTGDVAPDCGRVTLNGRDLSACSLSELAERRAAIGAPPDLAFGFTVADVIGMGWLHGRTPHHPAFQHALHSVLEATELEALAERTYMTLSSGERQRVLLARALAQAAPLLLLDEPTASLDVNHAVETLELVRAFVDDGDRGAIAAIHDLDAAARYCDEVVVLANGGVQAAGPPESVLSASTVGDAFDAEAFVGRNPATGTPAVTAFPPRDDDPRRVHVIGTGRPAARVVARLAAAGHEASVGVVPAGDAAAGAAADADATAVTAPPFEEPTPEAVAAARDLAADADATVAVNGGDDSESRVSGPNAEVAAAAGSLVAVSADVDDAALLDAVAAATDGE